MTRQRQEQTGITVNLPMANEHGFVMVMALMMLVVLSLMATAAMSVRNTEQAIVRNTEVMVTNFFGVEAVTLEGATVLENIDLVASDTQALSKLDTPGFDCATVDPNSAVTVDPNSAVLPNRPPDNLCWLQPNAAGTIQLEVNSDWHNAGVLKPQGTYFNAAAPNNRNLTPAGYAPDGSINGDRIWYAAVQGNLNSTSEDYQLCRGYTYSETSKQRVRCYSIHGMYDVKAGVGKAYTGRRMMMVGYQKTIYEN